MSFRKPDRRVKGFYVVERIVDQRIVENGEREYQVKWRSYSKKFNTWEPVHHLSEVMDLVEEFKKKKKKEEKSKLSFYFRKVPKPDMEKGISSTIVFNEVNHHLEEHNAGN